MSRFAIVGKGFIFDRHVQAIESLGHEVAMTCDIDESKNPDYTDWLYMFNRPEFDYVDAVSILTPNYLHGPIAREALRRGKKVLCEKPLAIDGTEGLDDVKNILQLRYHPELQKMNKPKNITVEAKMFRDDVYWNSWKGDPFKSGGVLYNLGVHYVDLAIFLLGDSWEIKVAGCTDKHAQAHVQFGESEAIIDIEVVDDRERQGRRLLADGKEITLSNQDNLSYEDLHKEVYKEFLAGRGVSTAEASKSIKLINAILETCKHSAPNV